MELFLKLYELGHPHYQKDRRLQPLLCGTAVVDADEMVHIYIYYFIIVVIVIVVVGRLLTSKGL